VDIRDVKILTLIGGLHCVGSVNTIGVAADSLSNETVTFGLKFCLDLDLTVSTARYKSVLSSERAPT
jgi:hypothetical protein